MQPTHNWCIVLITGMQGVVEGVAAEGQSAHSVHVCGDCTVYCEYTCCVCGTPVYYCVYTYVPLHQLV